MRADPLPRDTPATGWNKLWTDTLPDLTPEQNYAYIAQLQEMPLKVCSATVECDDPATSLVDFHGCDEVYLCEMHLDLRDHWIYDINKTIATQGQVPCTDCGLWFSSVPRIMTWRLI